MKCCVESCERSAFARGFCGLHYKRFMAGRPLTGYFPGRQSVERGGLAKLGLHKHHPFYMAWVNMKSRCDNPNSTQYEWYGGRGISYDPAWKDFAEFYSDMFPRWGLGLTLERVLVNENYSKHNCTWIPQANQTISRRPRGSNQA